MPSKPSPSGLAGLIAGAEAIEALLSDLAPRDAQATGETRAALSRAAALAETIAGGIAGSDVAEAEILARSLGRCAAAAAAGEVISAYVIAYGATGAAELVAILRELSRAGTASRERRVAAAAATYELDTLFPAPRHGTATGTPDVPISRLVDKRR